MKKGITEIGNGAYMCSGEKDVNVFFKPYTANAFVISEGDTIHVIDTGAGSEMVSAISRAINLTGNTARKLILINTHGHLDHIANNGPVIAMEGFEEKEHYLHAEGMQFLDPYSYFYNFYQRIDEYYDIFEGPPPPWKFISRLFSIGSREKHLKQLVNTAVGKYEPISTSKDTIKFLTMEEMDHIPLDSHKVDEVYSACDTVSINLGPYTLKGWKTGNAISIYEGGHSPDHIMVFFPERKLLIAGDLSLDLFPLYMNHSDSGRILKNLRALKEMATEGIISTIADGHHSYILKGQKQICEMVDRVIKTHQDFRTALFSCLERGRGETIKDLYRKLRKMRYINPSVDLHLEWQFPRTPIFLKTVIVSMLLEENCRVEGRGEKATFYRNTVG